MFTAQPRRLRGIARHQLCPGRFSIVGGFDTSSFAGWVREPKEQIQSFKRERERKRCRNFQPECTDFHLVVAIQVDKHRVSRLLGRSTALQLPSIQLTRYGGTISVRLRCKIAYFHPSRSDLQNVRQPGLHRTGTPNIREELIRR